jgi:hypothetical protein
MADDKEAGFLETIHEFHQNEPFGPFTIVMNSGERYLIELAPNLSFGKSQVYYAVPTSDRLIIMRLSQISSVERGEARPKRRRKSA